MFTYIIFPNLKFFKIVDSIDIIIFDFSFNNKSSTAAHPLCLITTYEIVM